MDFLSCRASPLLFSPTSGSLHFRRSFFSAVPSPPLARAAQPWLKAWSASEQFHLALLPCPTLASCPSPLSQGVRPNGGGKVQLTLGPKILQSQSVKSAYTRPLKSLLKISLAPLVPHLWDIPPPPTISPKVSDCRSPLF